MLSAGGPGTGVHTAGHGYRKIVRLPHKADHRTVVMPKLCRFARTQLCAFTA
jgi:hypothetical protein